MTDAIHRLVYYSRNQSADDLRPMTENIDQILAVSRSNNERDEITGAVLFNSGCFAQVLEGPLNKLEAAFERIQQDERHSDVSLLALDPIAKRCFPNWAMGFVGTAPGDAERFAEIGQASGFDPSRLDGDQLHALLRDLAMEEEQAA